MSFRPQSVKTKNPQCQPWTRRWQHGGAAKDLPILPRTRHHRDHRTPLRSWKRKARTKVPSIPRPERSTGTVRASEEWPTGRVERSSRRPSAASSTRRRSPKAWTASISSRECKTASDSTPTCIPRRRRMRKTKARVRAAGRKAMMCRREILPPSQERPQLRQLRRRHRLHLMPNPPNRRRILGSMITSLPPLRGPQRKSNHKRPRGPPTARIPGVMTNDLSRKHYTMSSMTERRNEAPKRLRLVTYCMVSSPGKWRGSEWR